MTLPDVINVVSRIWIGFVIGYAVAVWRRRRRHEPPPYLNLAARRDAARSHDEHIDHTEIAVRPGATVAQALHPRNGRPYGGRRKG